MPDTSKAETVNSRASAWLEAKRQTVRQDASRTLAVIRVRQDAADRGADGETVAERNEAVTTGWQADETVGKRQASRADGAAEAVAVEGMADGEQDDGLAVG